MHVDLNKIEKFYKTDIGLYARRSLLPKILRRLNVKSDHALVCSAASYPYAREVKEKVLRLSLQMYQEQDVPFENGRGHFIVTDRTLWPYRAEDVDTILMVHDLEFAENPEVYLREAWRVLKGEGKIIMAVSNRSGRWARHDNTPFGQGYPYSIDQIEKLLGKAHFSIDYVEGCLFFPPYEPKTKVGQWYRQLIESFGTSCFFTSGVYVIEASKHVYAPTNGLKRNERSKTCAKGIISIKGRSRTRQKSSAMR